MPQRAWEIPTSKLSHEKAFEDGHGKMQLLRKPREQPLFADATAISGRYFRRVLLDFFVKKSV